MAKRDENAAQFENYSRRRAAHERKSRERGLEAIGRSAIASIVEMTAILLDDEADYDAQDHAREAILQDALSLEITARGPSMSELRPYGYELLLCTGGPAVRIVGTLDRHCEPETARLEVQDWGTPWTEIDCDTVELGALMAYAQCFYFGEG